jgi:hypothetical protein
MRKKNFGENFGMANNAIISNINDGYETGDKTNNMDILGNINTNMGNAH